MGSSSTSRQCATAPRRVFLTSCHRRHLRAPPAVGPRPHAHPAVVRGLGADPGFLKPGHNDPLVQVGAAGMQPTEGAASRSARSSAASAVDAVKARPPPSSRSVTSTNWAFARIEPQPWPEGLPLLAPPARGSKQVRRCPRRATRTDPSSAGTYSRLQTQACNLPLNSRPLTQHCSKRQQPSACKG
jgi:hypothetical protein